MRAIAARAGITDAAIYYYFPAKEDLFRELIETDLKLYREGHPHLRTNDIAEAMLSLVDETIELLRDKGSLLTLILREALAGNPMALRRYRALLHSWEAHAAGLLRPFETTGQLEPGEAGQVARQVIHIVMMSFEDMLLMSHDRSLSTMERSQWVRQFIERSIKRLASGLTMRKESAGHPPAPVA